MTQDLYNHIKKYQNRFQKLKEQKVLRVGTGNNVKDIKLNLNNRDLVVKWLEYKKAELENSNGYEKNSQVRYCKTLYKEMTTYMSNILYWFNDKDLQDITEKDIKDIYIGIEQGKLKTIKGKSDLSFKTKKDYYGRVFKSGFFKFIGKDEMAKKVIKRKFNEATEVRFFDLDTLRVITDNAARNAHRLAFWLLFDTGMEVMALCQLKKSNFEWIQQDKYYMLHIPKEISKKSRKRRDIYIHFNETNELLKSYLETLKDTDNLFKFKPPALYHALKSVVDKYQLKTKPENKSITIKDFRSSMSTYFLQLDGWTTDDIKARLGHAPSSTEIDKYVNYLGINQKKQRKQAEQATIKDLEAQYKKMEESLRHMQQKHENQTLEIQALKVAAQTLFSGLTPQEVRDIVNQKRKEKGMITWEEEAKKGLEELRKLHKAKKLHPTIDKEFIKLDKEKKS